MKVDYSAQVRKTLQECKLTITFRHPPRTRMWAFSDSFVLSGGQASLSVKAATLQELYPISIICWADLALTGFLHHFIGSEAVGECRRLVHQINALPILEERQTLMFASYGNSLDLEPYLKNWREHIEVHGEPATHERLGLVTAGSQQ